MTPSRVWQNGRYVYPILDEDGRVIGWTHIPPTRRSPDYREAHDETLPPA